MIKRNRTPTWLSPRKLLSKKEFEKYKEDRTVITRRNLRERMKEIQAERKFRRQKAKYESTRSGKLGTGIAKIFGTLSQRGGVARALYRREGQLPPQIPRYGKKSVQGIKTGKRGRPVGTLDPRYARYGGVYGWRKAQAHQRALERMDALRRATVTPQQEIVLNQIRQRQAQMQMAPERRVIPTTYGTIPMKSYMQEIEEATKLVD